MALDIPSVLTWFIVGMLTGGIATQFLTGRGYGQGRDIGFGILGGLAAGFMARLAGIPGQPGLLTTAFAAFVGAVSLIALQRGLQRTSYVW